MTRFFRRWGAVVILAILWAGSWGAYWHFERLEEMQTAQDHQVEFVEDEFRTKFWAGTFENLQSEWGQLTVQGLLVIGMASVLFKKSKEDLDRIEKKVDSLIRKNS